MKLGLVLFGLFAACGGGQRGLAGAPATEDFATAFVHASQTGDVAAIRHMLGPSVLLAGVWFPDPVCTGEFAAPGEVGGGRLDELARCLAGLKLQVSPHQEQLVDVVALTYEPGFEIEARFLDTKEGPWLAWIGYEARRDRSDALPTVSPEALVSQALHRTSGETRITPSDRMKTAIQRAQVSALIGSFQYCLGPTGKVDSVDLIRSTGVPDYDAMIMSGMREWQYAPYLDDGKPVPVCSSVTFNYTQR